MHNDDSSSNEPSLVSNRTVEIGMALLFLLVSAIVIKDSIRLGYGWIEGEGPASGYFPFYIAVFMALASIMTLVQAIMGKTEDADESFVSKPAFGRVMSIVLPTLVYIALIGSIGPIPGLGLYVASAIFIFFFMIVFGHENPLKSAFVSAIVPIFLFFMFEKWFLVPLPKGPLEAMLGY